MEEKALINYLQDIVNLETQKRIAGNTYNRLLVVEKDNAFVLHAQAKEKHINSSVAKRVKWLPLFGKLYLGFIVEALVAVLLKWTIVFTLGLPFNISPESAEIFSMIVCVLAGSFLIIRNEFSKAQQGVESERESIIKYRNDVEKGKLILAQIQRDKPSLKQVYNQCDTNLKKLYALNIVYSDYQYLEACGMFLQYLRTGRTHCLEQKGGDAGAYNLYENDLKFNIIKRQLDRVLKNQQILYSALTEINNNVENLCGSVERIEKYSQQTAQNTKISTWCNAATAANTYALRRMQEEYIFFK